MRIKRSMLVGVMLVAVVGAMAPARAADTVIVSGPGGPFVGYSQPVAVVAPGGGVTYVNADIFLHDVVSVAYGPDTQSWCEGSFPTGQCPLFWTPLIGVGQRTPVLGLENVEPGKQYAFFCSIHTNMKGTLVVLPA